MSIVLTLGIAYFLLMTKLGEKVFVYILKKLTFLTLVLVNPVTVGIAIFGYLVFRGTGAD